MTKQGWIGIGAVVGILLLAAITIEIVHERELRIKAEVTIEANKQIIAVRDKADAKQQADTQIQKAAVTTAPQALKIITQLVPIPATSSEPGQSLPTQPQAVVVQPHDLSPQVQAQLPNSPSYSIFTQSQTIAQAKYDMQCEADRKSLATCQLDKSTLTDSLKTETAVAEGGTFWHRVGTGLKHAACGSSGGAAGVGVAGMKGSTPVNGLVAGGSVFLGCEAVSYFVGRSEKK